MVKWLEVNSAGKQQIQVTDGYLYLGITFTPSGSFSLAQKKPYNKATRSLYIYNGASVSTVLKLFYSLVSQSFCTTVKFGFFSLNQSGITMTNLSREFLMKE